MTHWIKDQNGKEYPVRYSNAVANQLAVEEKIPLNQISKFFGEFNSWEVGRAYRFYYLMFRYGAKKESRDFDMSFDDFIDFIAEDETIMPQVNEAMKASMPAEEKKSKLRVKR